MTTAPNQVHLDRLFDRVAATYDRQLVFERRALEVAARLIGPLDGLRVLDLATGTGALAAAMLDRSNPPAELTAIDRSAAMLARARTRLAPFEDRFRIGTAIADARRLPHAGDSFDLVTSAYFLHLLDREDAESVLGEVRRVLRLAGRLAVIVHSAPPTRCGGFYLRISRALRRAPPLVGAGPLTDARPLLEGSGFVVRAERRTVLGYWSQVLLCERV